MVCRSVLFWNTHSLGVTTLFVAIFSGKLHRFWVFEPKITLGPRLLETNPGILDSQSLGLVYKSEAPGDSKNF